MINKLFFAILILVGVSGTAGFFLLLWYGPHLLEDVEFRCQLNMQTARLTSAMNNNDVFIEYAVEMCESMKESEKRMEGIEKERKEYYRKKSRHYGN